MTTLKLTNFEILSTGADGGHNYISSEIYLDGQMRNIIVLFKNKSDERELNNKSEIFVNGNLKDQGVDQTLILSDSEIIN
ncbi:MAG: hypothetical protein ABWZ56_02295 [Flavobacterium sp.]